MSHFSNPSIKILSIIISLNQPIFLSSFKLSSNEGALVGDVVDDSPAGKAGIMNGDIILEFDGKKVRNARELCNMAAAAPVGKKVAVKILRDGVTQSLVLSIAKKPDLETLGSRESEDETGKELRLGMRVEELTHELAQSLNYKNEEGVVVTSVDPNSDASAKGIRPGDLVKKVGNKTIHSLADFDKAVKGLKKGDVIALLVRSSSSPSTKFVVLEVE